MSVNVILTPNFEREAKKLIKKYRSLRRELLDFTAELEGEPRIGVQISENIYKVRLAVRSKGKGKSGGMRIITYVETKLVQKPKDTDIYLLSIYDKSEQDNISNRMIAQIVGELQEELKQALSSSSRLASEEE
jgi:mRNA-degrading endonuclease RelE of RelBE toxin-antitoxin system